MANLELEIDEAPEVVPISAEEKALKVKGEPIYVRVSVPTGPPKAKPKAKIPLPEPVEVEDRGDDLIDEAQKASDFTEGERDQAHLIRSSLDLVIQKGKEDPQYGERVAGELSSLTGEEYAQKAVDAADNLKIDYLKKTFPDRFNSASAAMTSFLNEASFGQLTRLIGGANSAANAVGGSLGMDVNGVPYEEMVKQKAEEFRLLGKAFPGYDFAGKAAAFLVPGSPVKTLFEKTAKIGAKGAGALLGQFAKNPSLLQKMFQSGVSGAAGAAAVGAVDTAIGHNNQEVFSLDRVKDSAGNAGKAVLGAGFIGALIPPAGQALSAGVKGAAPYVRAVAKRAGRTVERAVEELSGVPANSLRAHNRNPKAMREAAGSENEIGQSLVNWLMDRRKSKLPELDAADALLDKLPDVPVGKLLNYLRSFKKGADAKLDSQVELLHQWAARIESRLPTVEVATKEAASSGGLISGAERVPITRINPKARISARQMRELVDDLQDAAQDQFGQESNFYLTAIKKASHEARMAIIETAKREGGAAGKLYDRSMTKAAGRVELLKWVSRQLGRDETTMRQNAQAFIDRIFSKNKEFRAARLAEMDAKFGTNFLERARLAQMAEDVGAKGTPAFFSRHSTGRSLLGMAVGGAIGGAADLVVGGDGKIGAALGGVASSPKAGAMLIGVSDSMTQFARRMIANPEAIARLAGQLHSKLPKNVSGELLRRGGSRQEQAAYDAVAKKLTSLKVPVEIERLAQEIEKTLTKDGPKSAMGTIRIIADTPYFAGLVHYYDLIERRQGRKDTESAISKMGGADDAKRAR